MNGRDVLRDGCRTSLLSYRYVVEDLQTKAFARFTKPGYEASAVVSELQQKFLFVATMGDVPDLARDVMSINSCHAPPDQSQLHHHGLNFTPENRAIAFF